MLYVFVRPGLIAGRSILHEDGAASLGEGPSQMPLEDLLVHPRIHLRVGLNKIDLVKFAIAK